MSIATTLMNVREGLDPAVGLVVVIADGGEFAELLHKRFVGRGKVYGRSALHLLFEFGRPFFENRGAGKKGDMLFANGDAAEPFGRVVFGDTHEGVLLRR